MTTVTERKSGSFRRYERRKRLSGGSSVGFEPLSWLKPRLLGSPRRLSAGFGLGLAPSQTQQKSRRQPADGSRRQFTATPPARKLLAFGLCQRAQGPQKPKGRRNHLNPDLNAPFSFSAVELPTGQSQIAFHKSLEPRAAWAIRFPATRARRSATTDACNAACHRPCTR